MPALHGAALLALGAAATATNIVTPSSFDKFDAEGSSAAYKITTAGNVYASGPTVLIDLHGTRQEQGFAFGRMGGKTAKLNYQALLGALLGKRTPKTALEQAALEVVLDWQWKSVLSVQVPANLMEEAGGFGLGCAKATPADARWCAAAWGRMQVLANLPGDLADVEYVLLDELPKAVAQEAEAKLGTGESVKAFVERVAWPPAMCSMWAAWGSRTAGGRVLSGRNLDWNHDTGLDQHKLVTVSHPPEAGLHAHATFGFAGLAGALAGMSAAGLTVHEANLESNRDSFRGFPWLLRLRHVMESAANLAEAKAVWETTNNTVGFNHMVASAADAKALVIETNAATSAYFEDNDPREADAAFPQPSGVVRGAPLPEAVWRTNHGFDPRIVSRYMWNGTHAYNNSDYRYHLIAGKIGATAPAAFDVADAVDLTALVGQKGEHWTACVPPFSGGSNVLSVAFDPKALTAYAAWEDGAGTGTDHGSWRPAACNAYLMIELEPWFSGAAQARYA